MKKLNCLLLLAMGGLALTSCHHTYSKISSAEYVKASGIVVKKSVEVSSFHSIRVSSAINVFLTNADERDVSIEIDEAFVKYIDISVLGGVLDIKSKGNLYTGDSKRVINVYVSSKNVRDVKVSGASTIILPDVLVAPSFGIDVSGASSFKGSVECGNLSIQSSGASGVRLLGNVKKVVVRVSGASNVDLSRLDADSVDCHASGASHVMLNAIKDIAIYASGASDVTYKGGAMVSRLQSSGASSVTKK